MFGQFVKCSIIKESKPVLIHTLYLFSNWKWDVEKMLATGSRLRSTLCKEFPCSRAGTHLSTLFAGTSWPLSSCRSGPNSSWTRCWSRPAPQTYRHTVLINKVCTIWTLFTTHTVLIRDFKKCAVSEFSSFTNWICTMLYCMSKGHIWGLLAPSVEVMGEVRP